MSPEFYDDKVSVETFDKMLPVLSNIPNHWRIIMQYNSGSVFLQKKASWSVHWGINKLPELLQTSSVDYKSIDKLPRLHHLSSEDKGIDKLRGLHQLSSVDGGIDKLPRLHQLSSVDWGIDKLPILHQISSEDGGILINYLDYINYLL